MRRRSRMGYDFGQRYHMMAALLVGSLVTSMALTTLAGVIETIYLVLAASLLASLIAGVLFHYFRPSPRNKTPRRTRFLVLGAPRSMSAGSNQSGAKPWKRRRVSDSSRNPNASPSGCFVPVRGDDADPPCGQ